MSTRAKVSKGKGKKGKDKMAAKRSAVSDLTEQNEALLRDKESLQQELGEAAGKLSTVVHTLVDSLDEKVRLKKFHITKDMDHMKVGAAVFWVRCLLRDLLQVVEFYHPFFINSYFCDILITIQFKSICLIAINST